MSLLIKGVDMPKSGESMTYFSKEIIEIPAPHGRLIDADRLMQWIEHVYGDKDIIKFITDDIKRQPTIVEAEGVNE